MLFNAGEVSESNENTVISHDSGTISSFRPLPSDPELLKLRRAVRLNRTDLGPIPAERFLMV